MHSGNKLRETNDVCMHLIMCAIKNTLCSDGSAIFTDLIIVSQN